MLYRILTQLDAHEYNQHISQLEREQSEFLHISKEQITVIKSTINSVNTTLKQVNKNEKILKDTFIKLSKDTDNKFNQLFIKMDMVNMLNEQIRVVIQRATDENEHSFELLIDALVHAEQGILQPQAIVTEKTRKIMEE